MRFWIPGGDLGTWVTLRQMRALVRAAVAERLTVETAQAIVRACPPRDVRCEATTLRAWLARHFRFIRDPATQETLRPPRVLLAQLERDRVISGDCDDAAVLGAALAAAIGFRPYAVVTGFRRAGQFRHVYATVPIDPAAREWIDFDVTRPDGPVPAVQRHLAWRL